MYNWNQLSFLVWVFQEAFWNMWRKKSFWLAICNTRLQLNMAFHFSLIFKKSLLFSIKYTTVDWLPDIYIKFRTTCNMSDIFFNANSHLFNPVVLQRLSHCRNKYSWNMIKAVLEVMVGEECFAENSTVKVILSEEN